MLDYPIVQDTSIGYVRSPLDRQKLVDYMQSLVSDSVKYGQVRMVDDNQEHRKNIVVESLRNIAFAAPKVTPAHAEKE